jgi:hypothetical protein
MKPEDNTRTTPIRRNSEKKNHNSEIQISF